MNTILYIALDGFYTNVVPDKADGVYQVVHHEGVVLESCARSKGKGVKAGTALSEARAVIREGCAFTEFATDDYIDARNVWLDRVLAYSENIESRMPHEVWIDMGGHPDPADVACLLLRDLATRFVGWGFTVGLAPAKWVAQVVSQDVDRDALMLGLPVIGPVTNMAEFLSQVPTSFLKPIPEKHRTRLDFLGYRWARTVASASLTVLTEQFGKDAFMIYECARGRATDNVEPNYPSGAISSRISFGHQQDSALLIEQAFAELSGKLAYQLCATDQTAEEMRLFCEVEQGEPLVWKRSFARPVQSASPLRVAVSALWNQAKDKQPPVALRLLLSGLQRAPRGQTSFIGLASKKERMRSCEVAVKCLKASFGDDVVIPATDISVPRRQQVLRAWKRATGWG